MDGKPLHTVMRNSPISQWRSAVQIHYLPGLLRTTWISEGAASAESTWSVHLSGWICGRSLKAGAGLTHLSVPADQTSQAGSASGCALPEACSTTHRYTFSMKRQVQWTPPMTGPWSGSSWIFLMKHVSSLLPTGFPISAMQIRS